MLSPQIGGVPATNRNDIVQRFNADPVRLLQSMTLCALQPMHFSVCFHWLQTIDLLLLTTKIGGLGLSLTGADTVVFMEHDWNPGFILCG